MNARNEHADRAKALLRHYFAYALHGALDSLSNDEHVEIGEAVDAIIDAAVQEIRESTRNDIARRLDSLMPLPRPQEADHA